MSFELANRYTFHHLIAQPSDLRLNPPESYFYVQDFFIISCGVLYALCYMFYMTRTYKDKKLSGTVLFMATTLSYELYYAFATTTTRFELVAFLAWFLMDVAFCTVAIIFAYPRSQRRITAQRLILSTLAGLVFFHTLCQYFPDEREQLTAFWTGIVLQLPISVSAVYLLLKEKSTKGHSLEIWITRYLGCWTAYGLFAWRYMNVPQNWEYVANIWSILIIGATLLAETIYPFVYVWAFRQEQGQKNKSE